MMYQVLSGALMMTCFVAGLFFYKFWKKSHDRLFFLFSLAFLSLSLERFVLGVIGGRNEPSPLIYLIRLGAFVLIIYAIVDRNRREA